MTFTIAISKVRTPYKTNPWLWIFISIFSIIWADSLIGATDINNWILENIPTLMLLIFLITTYKKYQFSDLSYFMFFIILCLHVYGSKYTYTENPFGYWLKDYFNTSRNHYDRIVHFSSGLLFAYPAREFFLKWMKFPKLISWILPIELALSVSALYEIVEWAVADVFFAGYRESYLGTQGDIWDAQKDIFLAFSGAVLAMTIVFIFQKIFKENQSDPTSSK